MNDSRVRLSVDLIRGNSVGSLHTPSALGADDVVRLLSFVN